MEFTVTLFTLIVFGVVCVTAGFFLGRYSAKEDLYWAKVHHCLSFVSMVIQGSWDSGNGLHNNVGPVVHALQDVAPVPVGSLSTVVVPGFLWWMRRRLSR